MEESEEKNIDSKEKNESEHKNYDFTGYQEFLEVLRTKYDEVSKTHLSRKSGAQKRLRLMVASFTLFVAAVSNFLGLGIFSLNSITSPIIINLFILTGLSFLLTVYYLIKFLKPREMRTIDMGEEKWGDSEYWVSDPVKVEGMLESLTKDLSKAVRVKDKKNEKHAREYKFSTYGLIIYFFSLIMLIITLTAVKI